MATNRDTLLVRVGERFSFGEIGADFPQAASQVQVGDTFVLQANAAGQSRTELVRDACRRLHTAWRQLCPHAALPGLAPALSEGLWGSEPARPEFVLDKADRDAREESIRKFTADWRNYR